MISIENKLKHRVFIVDDHPIVREGLTVLLNQEHDLEVCGDASNVAQALESIALTKPDVVIVDLALGQSSGLKLIEALTLNYPDIVVLALSMHDESLYAERCLTAGAKGYIMKHEPPGKVISALRRVIGGDIYISDNLGARLLQKIVSGKPSSSVSTLERLSNRELEVFQLIGHGIKTRKIAEQLNLSIKTIETYIDHIKKKMSFEDSRSLFLHAVQWTMNNAVK